MPTRSYTEVIRGIQGALGPLFKSRRFQVLGLTYNRPTEEGLTQVINIQVSPRTLPYPRWQDYEARFTINLGIYVPEIAWYFADVFYRSWVEEYMCCVSQRLGFVS